MVKQVAETYKGVFIIKVDGKLKGYEFTIMDEISFLAVDLPEDYTKDEDYLKSCRSRIDHIEELIKKGIKNDSGKKVIIDGKEVYR